MVVCGAFDLFHTGLVVTLGEAAGVEVIEPQGASISVETVAGMRADVAFIDLDLWGGEGVDFVRSLAESQPAVNWIAVTSSHDIDLPVAALRAGMRGVMMKTANRTEFVEAARSVGDGNVVLAPHIAEWLVNRIVRQSSEHVLAPQRTVPGNVELTPRQQEILKLLGAGLSNAEIAEKLSLSKTTVKSHVSALLRTLNVRDRTQLALLAYRGGPE